jgi:hypothetical protein
VHGAKRVLNSVCKTSIVTGDGTWIVVIPPAIVLKDVTVVVEMQVAFEPEPDDDAHDGDKIVETEPAAVDRLFENEVEIVLVVRTDV